MVEFEPSVADSVNFPLPEEIGQDESPYEWVGEHSKNNFKAWHRPRKQYVRDKQWVSAIEDVLSGRDVSDGLKYVGLPGVDLLDLRQIIADICEPTGRVLRYLGYDIAAGDVGQVSTELNVSEAELKANRLVDNRSLIRPDDFRHVASAGTAARWAAEKMTPADVINLDLTGHLFHEGSAEGRSYESAVRELLKFQIANPRPWLLLLTTRVDRASASPEKLRKLAQGLEESLVDCPEVRALLSKQAEHPFSVAAMDTCSEADLGLFTIVGTLRWIHELLTAPETVKTRPKFTSCFMYTSYEGGGCPDMASLVIKFRRLSVTLKDTTFSSGDAAPPVVDACADLTGYVNRAAARKNIDELLSSDSALWGQMVERSAKILSEARYDVAAYREWVRAYCS